MSEPVLDFLQFQLAQTESRAAFERYDAASTRLENCRIKERAAELRSQSLASIAKGALVKDGEITTREREIALALVRYAVYGRTGSE